MNGNTNRKGILMIRGTGDGKRLLELEIPMSDLSGELAGWATLLTRESPTRPPTKITPMASKSGAATPKPRIAS